MSLAVAFQMDPIEGVNIDADSSFVLALEAQRRGHKLWFYTPKQLSLRVSGGRTTAVAAARPMTLRREKGNHATLGAPVDLDLRTIDVVLLRQDPPFDLAYITTTHMLDHVHPETLVVNDPAAVRNAPEKLLVTQFPQLMPPTLITRNRQEILAFRAEHKDIIVKPLWGNGGIGVFHLPPGDENLGSLTELFELQSTSPWIVQRYQPEVRKGDKRIILIDGEPMGAINRVPAEGESRANMHVGGRPEPAELTQRDKEICAALGPTLKRQGLVFTGIDVIGDYLTEINVTSPTGLQEIGRFTGKCLEARIWDVIEQKRKAMQR